MSPGQKNTIYFLGRKVGQIGTFFSEKLVKFVKISNYQTNKI